MEIELNQGKILRISPEDQPLLSHRWTAVFNPWRCGNKRGNNWYAQRRPTVNGRRVTVYLHRVIMNPPPGFVVDHLNGDGLDNRRENLEIVEHRENIRRGKERQWQ